MEGTIWSHLPLLVRSNSKDSVESILQSLWRTRNTGLTSSDRHVILNMLQLPNDSDLDPVTYSFLSFTNIVSYAHLWQKFSTCLNWTLPFISVMHMLVCSTWLCLILVLYLSSPMIISIDHFDFFFFLRNMNDAKLIF